MNFVYLLAWQILGDKIKYYSSKNQTKAMAENDLSLKIYFSRLKKTALLLKLNNEMSFMDFFFECKAILQ